MGDFHPMGSESDESVQFWEASEIPKVINNQPHTIHVWYIYLHLP